MAEREEVETLRRRLAITEQGWFVGPGHHTSTFEIYQNGIMMFGYGPFTDREEAWKVLSEEAFPEWLQRTGGR